MSKLAVIFDLDGTLLNTLDDLCDAVNHLLNNHGYPSVSKMKVRRYLGNGAAELVRCALPEKVNDDIFERYLNEYKEYYAAHSNIKTKPYDGVLELLKDLKARGIAVAVVSNKPDAAVKILCHEYFGDLVCFALGDRPNIERKPSAAPVHFAMKSIGCRRAVFVGDSEVDVMTAANAGLPCISLTWGFRDREILEEYGALHFADDADQLNRLISELLSAGE